MANNIGFGKIYDSTWWGNGVTDNSISWGSIYKDLAGSDDFIITVKTDNEGTSGTNQFTIPTTGTGFLYDITTSDGYTATGVTGNHTITFPSGAGTHTVTISGSFPQCYFNNGGDKAKLMSIENFGDYALGSTSQNAAFYGCSNLVINATDVGNFGGVTNFNSTWRNCSSLTSFPLLDTSSGNNFDSAWSNCSSLTSFPLLDTSSGTNFNNAWRNCTSLTSFPLLDVSSGTSFSNAWRNCNSLTSFPLIDTSSSITFIYAWYNCSSLTSFPSNAFDSSTASNYTNAFTTTNLTTQSIDDILVSLDTSGVNNGTFSQSGGQGPSYVGSIAVNNLIAKGWTITTSTPVASPEFAFTVKTDNAGTSGTNQFTIPTSTTGITQAFNYDIETSDGQSITGVTGNHTITFPSAGTYDVKISGSFPYMYFNNGGDKDKLLDIKNFGIYALGSTSQNAAFYGCSNLVINATDVGNFGGVTDFLNAWRGCLSITSFPLLDTSSVTIFAGSWIDCSSLTSFPLIDTSSGTNFIAAWRGCSSLISFPLIDTSSGTNFSSAWFNCLSLTSFPLLDTSSGTNLFRTWRGCSSLTTFSANAFDTNIATDYGEAFLSTNLTTQSIDDILVSLDTSGISNGTLTQSGGQAPSATGEAAIDSLVGKGWTITVTGGYTP